MSNWAPDVYGALRSAEEAVSAGVRAQAAGIWAGIVAFAMRDNVIEVAVGLTVATAYTNLINTIIGSLVMPLAHMALAAVLGRMPVRMPVDLPLPGSKINVVDTVPTDSSAGSTLDLGAVVAQVMNLVGLGITSYMMATVYGLLNREAAKEVATTVTCAYCLGEIDPKAKRCRLCTSWLDGREERLVSVN
ncbi:hypothetical protein BD779DRAFT_1787125 [Infundibulicybe gibba]|nr:hypothetical protein BD779DRAFT_1701677 [Infundibulicybe gibba]KAF8884849.1 hypothetical protein BD779DRAFT_1787125 [Infundibulicybe gibba]